MTSLKKSLAFFLKYRAEFLTLGFIAIYTLAAIIVSVLRFWQFEAGYFDFGVNDQAIWSVSRFNLPITYHPNYLNGFGIHLADHFSPSIYMLSPLYWITSKQEIILIAQALSVGLSAVIGWQIARRFIKNNLAIFALIFTYLGFIGMQNALITEFHEATLSPLFILLSFWAIINKRWKLFYACLFIILGLKETFAGLATGIGIFMLLFDRKNLKHAVLTIIISLSWALLITKLVIPSLSGRPYFYAPEHGIESFFEMLKAFLQLDIRLKTLFYSLLSFGFLPLFNISLLPAISENFLSRFLAEGYPRYTLGFHYSAPLSAIMFFSSVLVFSRIEKSKRLRRIIIPYSLFLILNSVILHQFILHGPLALSYNKAFYSQTKNTRYIESFTKKVPTDGLIMAQNDIAARFTHHKVMMLDRNYPHWKAKYIVLNLTPGQNPNNFFPLTYDDSVELKNRIIQENKYSLKKYGEELYLFTIKE